MDRPRITCHMASSLDGRILPRRWQPDGAHSASLYEELHGRLGGGSWIVGRTTAQEFARRDGYPGDFSSGAHLPREPWLPKRGANAYAFMIDAHGKISWGRSEIDGDPIVVILTEAVPDAHLAALRQDGVGYIFAGRYALDLKTALVAIRRDLGVRHLILEGGGVINGEFLRAGHVDEISVMIVPAIDGRPGAPAVFDAADEGADAPPLSGLHLTSHEVLDTGTVWLRYDVAV